ncbi:hypothetical protein [Sorangium atrum]|uniref:Uncharacterized protein n=1 Tax=Sorangium atrum TaxID=2995308 RepID=A0ABT5CD86_9BACT|nr:hypothetical protein [Sorangium aterium]MDC0684406.1 hypothetical protein [Sorangium aterium]
MALAADELALAAEAPVSSASGGGRGAMRSVVVFLRDTTESAVTAHLDAAYPEQREPWVVFVAGDACLYINLYRHGPLEHEPEDWADIVQRLGGEPAACVIADVSGRHPGDEQVAGFVAGLLSRFSGAAMDDYTRTCGRWTSYGAGTGFVGTRSSTTRAGSRRRADRAEPCAAPHLAGL